MTTTRHAVSFLGLGEMGAALARAALHAGHPTTVWNRSAEKALSLVEAGARATSTAADAVVAADLIVVCLFDHQSVHEVLDGGIMATPDMIGTPHSSVLYSGSQRIFDEYLGLLE
jgi:3-hydroxyisobutyrate dehydrogenase-like beta-hydroxyacid dehydrogenase